MATKKQVRFKEENNTIHIYSKEEDSLIYHELSLKKNIENDNIEDDDIIFSETEPTFKSYFTFEELIESSDSDTESEDGFDNPLVFETIPLSDPEEAEEKEEFPITVKKTIKSETNFTLLLPAEIKRRLFKDAKEQSENKGSGSLQSIIGWRNRFRETAKNIAQSAWNK